MKNKILVLLVFCLLFVFVCGCCESKMIFERGYRSNDEIKAEMAEMNIYPLYGDMYVHFIDVGQGDCIFIQLANGQTMLIDAGNSDNGSEIVNYIKNNSADDNIDYVVITNPYDDHIGGMAEIVNNIDINAIYMPELNHSSYTCESLLDTIDKNNVDLYKAKADTNILKSGPITIDILAPKGTKYKELNDYSVVVRLTYGETVFLFMGDASASTEQDLLKNRIDADVLKVGNHGSDSASSEAFIRAVSPTVAVISCSADNQYGCPHVSTLSILNKYGAEIYRTDKSGTIIVTADMHKKISINK